VDENKRGSAFKYRGNDLMKNKGFKPLAAALLLIFGTANALAQPDETARTERIGAPSLPVLVQLADRGGQGGDQQQRGGGRGRTFGLPENSGFGSNRDYAGRGSGDDSQQRQGKMSPEERRALRRQIDEAGHDIYTPKR
jgi:hypothetical protein